jgi:hypothetical protein
MYKFSLIAALAVVLAYPSAALARFRTVPERNITIKTAHVSRPLIGITVPIGTTCARSPCATTCTSSIGLKTTIGYCQ